MGAAGKGIAFQEEMKAASHGMPFVAVRQNMRGNASSFEHKKSSWQLAAKNARNAEMEKQRKSCFA
jgi:hypothetical protein